MQVNLINHSCMAVRQDTIWEKFLKPIFQLIIDQEEIRNLYHRIDWENASQRFCSPQQPYPDYYLGQNFHGIEGGYLTSGAAVTYDPITEYVLPPNETWVRQGLIDKIKGRPRRILDLGCGTGTTTLMLKQAFPQAEVVGLDLSPYMLVMADDKAQKAGLKIKWLHSNAETTALPDGSFDLVTASLLFHETPPQVSQSILRESFRLLQPGGEMIILDGNQLNLRRADWLTNVFEEPYIQAYAAGSVDAWLGAAGFQGVQTEELWWIHQVSRGTKPIPVSNADFQWDKITDFPDNVALA